MKTVRIHKAQQTLKSQQIPSVAIVLDEEIKSAETLEEIDIVFSGDAAAICDALEKSLPGGTFDRLLFYMLERKASHFVVSHKE
jgi:hypothetical protein